MKNSLQFNPEKVLSRDEISSILHLEKGIGVGEMITPSLSNFRDLMNLWVSRMDEYILKARMKDMSAYISLLERYRAFTYEEFQLIFKNIPEEKFKHYPIFKFLRIPSMDYLVEFRLGMEENIQTYFQVLMEASQDLDGRGIDFFLRGLRTKIPIRELKRHGYICGATGSGKSELMRLLLYRLVKESKNSEYSVVLIDPHGDLSKQIKTSKLYAESDRFIFFEPELIPGFTPVINPLEISNTNRNSVVTYAQNLSNAIEEAIGADLSVNMGAILIPCLTLLISRKGSTLLDLIKLMQDDPELIAEGKRLPNEAHRFIFKNFKNKLYTRTKASIFTKLQSFLNYPAFYHATVGKSTINIRHAINTGKVVVFNLSHRYFGSDAAAAYGRFIISMIKSTITMRGEYRKPTFLFVDECQQFISPSVKDILEQTRKYGLHLVMANQSVESLGSIENVVLGNTSVKIIGRNDSLQTLKKFSTLTGSHVSIFQSLRNYHFYLKTSLSTGQIFKASDVLILDKSLTISSDQERELNAKMVDKYYTKIREVSPSEENDNFTTKYEI